MPQFNFNHKVVVVSGGGSGIGYAISRSFLADGANLVIAGRRTEKLEKACDSLHRELGDIANRLCLIPTDLSNSANAELLVREAKNRFGSLDIFVNNAGTWALIPIVEFNEELLSKHINSNLKATMYGTQAAARNMNKGGVIVNIGSFAGLMPMKNASVYSCLKAAIISFTQSAATELAPLGIRVNCVVPGVIRTEMTSDYIDENYLKIIQPIALKRIGEAQEVANGVLFLCSELASYITGSILEISGGKFCTQL